MFFQLPWKYHHRTQKHQRKQPHVPLTREQLTCSVPPRGILFSQEHEWTPATQINLDTPQKHIAVIPSYQKFRGPWFQFTEATCDLNIQQTIAEISNGYALRCPLCWVAWWNLVRPLPFQPGHESPLCPLSTHCWLSLPFRHLESGLLGHKMDWHGTTVCVFEEHLLYLPRAPKHTAGDAGKSDI